MARRNHKKRRTDAASVADAGPSAAFLAALASQRESARRREQQVAAQQPSPSQARSPPAPKELPGFYYDESTQRYFRCAPEHQRRGKSHVSLSAAPPTHGKSARPAGARRRCALPASSLQACLDRRQQSCAWSPSAHDTRTLQPLFLGQLFAAQVLEPQAMGTAAARSRLTGLALHSQASNLGAAGYSTGRVEILGTERAVETRARSDMVGGGGDGARVKVHAKHVVKLQEVSVGASCWVSSLQWRPQRSLDLLFSAVGSSQAGGSPHPGFVGLLDVGQEEVSAPRKWPFTDPWTASWNPYAPTGFSVGMGADSLAAFVIPEIPGRSGTMFAPRGLIRSPVTAQAFFRQSQLILNGSRNGSLWVWDLRARRRAQELANDRPSAVACLDILQDDLNVVIQRSDGQLALMDVRKYSLVRELARGRPNTHLPMLKFAVDSGESVVVAAGTEDPHAVTTYSVQTGRPVASVRVARPRAAGASGDVAVAPVEQVHFLRAATGSTHPGGPELWALSRSDLFMCSSWRTDVVARE